MKELDALIHLIEKDPTVKRYQTIESIIASNDTLQRDYQALLKMQKQMVQQQVKKDKKLSKTKEQYQTILNRLESHPLFNEYLSLQDEINQDLQLIKKMIEDGLDSFND
jgi:cell fate (sporulation/competence/biofilm development) regulator YmcA (YheA/YmcA/DUF963 family)